MHFSESRAEIPLPDLFINGYKHQFLISYSKCVGGVVSSSTDGLVMIWMQKYESTGQITPYFNLWQVCWGLDLDR